MLQKLTVVLLVLSFAVICYSKSESDPYPNYDHAPGVVPGHYQGTDDQWDLLYAWETMEAQSGDNGMLGIIFDGTSLWVSGRGVTSANMIYLFDPATGVMTGSFPTGTTSLWGVRDMCTDGDFIYGGEDGGLRVFDIASQTMVSTIPFPGGMSFQRANAYDPATDHFYAGNFGSTCYEQDRNGVLIRQWPAPTTAIYGMAWDDDALDGPWLWIHDQTSPMSGCNVHQFDPVTLMLTGFNVTLNVPPSAADMAGGLEYCSGIDPIYTTMLVFNQGTPDAGAAFEMYMDTPPTAPAAPADFIVTGSGATLMASLAWTNPTLTVGGDPLTDLIGIKVERDGEEIADLTPATPGAAMDYFDFTVPAAGLYEYSVYGYNADDGIPASGEVFIGELDVEVVLTPYGAPIVIPAGGGVVEFNIELTNNELNQISCGVWTMITHPNGVYGPVINVVGFPFAASSMIERDRSQAIPAGAPAGAYSYDAYVGIYPTVVWDEDHIDFTKAADGDGFDYGDWYSWGAAFPGEIITAPPVMPVSFSLSKAYPNPFNPVATIGYTLAERSQVELVVYDVTGREVATLVNSTLNAGAYNATFQAEGLSSGVYFYRLTAGDFTAVNKMILMK